MGYIYEARNGVTVEFRGEKVVFPRSEGVYVLRDEIEFPAKVLIGLLEVFMESEARSRLEGLVPLSEREGCACAEDPCDVRPISKALVVEDDQPFLFFHGESCYHLCPRCLAWCDPYTGEVSMPGDMDWLRGGDGLSAADRISISFWIQKHGGVGGNVGHRIL